MSVRCPACQAVLKVPDPRTQGQASGGQQAPPRSRRQQRPPTPPPPAEAAPAAGGNPFDFDGGAAPPEPPPPQQDHYDEPVEDYDDYDDDDYDAPQDDRRSRGRDRSRARPQKESIVPRKWQGVQKSILLMGAGVVLMFLGFWLAALIEQVSMEDTKSPNGITNLLFGQGGSRSPGRRLGRQAGPTSGGVYTLLIFSLAGMGGFIAGLFGMSQFPKSSGVPSTSRIAALLIIVACLGVAALIFCMKSLSDPELKLKDAGGLLKAVAWSTVLAAITGIAGWVFFNLSVIRASDYLKYPALQQSTNWHFAYALTQSYVGLLLFILVATLSDGFKSEQDQMDVTFWSLLLTFLASFGWFVYNLYLLWYGIYRAARRGHLT